MLVRVLLEFTPSQSDETSQYGGLMQGNVIGLVAIYFILWHIRGGTVNVAFVIYGLPMHFDDCSAYASRFRIPAHVIANFERLDHCAFLSPITTKEAIN
jgi:hypothetical protein